jgi:hypothetical protein
LPRWLIVTASVAILFHLTATIVRALNAQSGPWPTPLGENYFPPPTFASSLYNSVPGAYLKAVRLTHNNHFPTNQPTGRANQPGGPAVSFEVRFHDREGKQVTLTFPEAGTNPWVRHRQKLLASALGLDMPVAPPQLEAVAPPGKEAPSVVVWEMNPKKGNILELKRIEQHLLPRDRPVSRPSDLAMLFVKSYARYLCRTYDVDKVEIVRFHQNSIPPDFLTVDVPPGEYDKVQSNFGELSR